MSLNEPFRLIRDNISHDMLICTRQINAQAECGDLIGIAYGLMYRGRNYVVNVAGEAYRNPGFARSVVSVLDDALSAMIWDGRDIAHR